ncbi:MAG: hypothetical protein WA634_12700 [Silvibacterium sp.]
MVRRVCFDIQSDFFIRPLALPLDDDPNEARWYLKTQWRSRRKGTCKFQAASAFDDSNQQYMDFTDCNRFFAYLLNADEIITFNGRKYDFVVLENVVGEEAAKALWARPHHDLWKWEDYPRRLEEAVAHFLPQLKPRFEDVRTERRAELGPLDSEDALLNWLAGTYRDVFFTYKLFLKYLESGDSGRTFCNDLEILEPLEQL